MNFIYEYEEIAGYYSDPVREERANAFLTLLVRKNEAQKASKGDEYNGVYVNYEEAMLTLGKHHYKEAVLDFADFGFDLKNETSTYKHGLFYFEENYSVYEGTKTPVKNVWLDKNITALRKIKNKNLSIEGKKVYKQMKHWNITCDLDQYNEALTKHYPSYLEERKGLKKPYLSLPEYLKANRSFYGQIKDFRSARGYELLDFISEDKFGKRVHTIMSCSPSILKREGYVTIRGNKVVPLDLKQSQPTILAHTLEERIGKNDFSDRFHSEDDIYKYIQRELGLTSRGAAKETLFSMIYGRTNTRAFRTFRGLFPQAARFISDFKSVRIPANPSIKLHSNLVWLMQNKESQIFRKIWLRLSALGISFAPIHDEILVEQGFEQVAKDIMDDVLSGYFKNFEVKFK